MVTHI